MVEYDLVRVSKPNEKEYRNGAEIIRFKVVELPETAAPSGSESAKASETSEGVF